MLKKNIGLLSLAFLVFFSESLTAKVFFWDGHDGQRYYSDQDPKGIEANEMPLTGNTFYSVIKVYDGDTVLLGNRLKVRLLSIILLRLSDTISLERPVVRALERG